MPKHVGPALTYLSFRLPRLATACSDANPCGLKLHQRPTDTCLRLMDGHLKTLTAYDTEIECYLLPACLEDSRQEKRGMLFEKIRINPGHR